MSYSRYAVVEIGNSNTRIGWDFISARKFRRQKIPTLPQYLRHIRTVIRILRGLKVSKIILAIASPFDIRRGKLLYPPNLPDYRGREPKIDFKKAGITAIMFNDLELAGLGEANYGAGRGYDIVAFVSLATGAGGAFIKDGQIMRGKYNFEAGHHILNIDNPIVPGKAIGTFESFLSGSALRSSTKKDPATLPSGHFKKLIPRLSQALANVIAFWSPGIIILGGPVAERFRPFLRSVQKKLKEMVIIIPPPRVVMGRLGDDAALAGGFAIMTKYRHFL